MVVHVHMRPHHIGGPSPGIVILKFVVEVWLKCKVYRKKMSTRIGDHFLR